MADQNWLARIAHKISQPSEVKELRSQLDTVVGELRDKADAYETKFLDVEPSNWNTHFFADFNAIDQQIDAAALARVYTTETWVYSAVSAIVTEIAALPTLLEKRQIIKKTKLSEVTQQQETVDEEVWIDASGEKLNRLFQKPNPFCSKTELINLILIDLLTAGEFFIYLDSDVDLSTIDARILREDDPNGPFNRLRTQLQANTPIKGMYRLPPSMMKPIPSKDRVHIDGFFMLSDRGNFAFSNAEVIHVKLPNPVDPFRGLSPLVAAFKPVLLDRFSTEHMVRFYKAGARLGGVITTEKSLNKEQLGRFQRSFENNYTGRQNHHRTLILPPGMKYDPIEQNPAETALLEFCKYNREAILSVYRVPPIKLGLMDNANYANARVQLKTFFRNTIKPILGFVQDGFNNHPALMPDSHNFRFRFDLTQVDELQEDFADKADAAKGMLDAGLTFDEVRKMVWKAQPLPKDGDKLKLQLEIELRQRGAAGNANPATLSVPAPEATKTKEVLPVAQPAETQVNGTRPTKGTFTERVQALVAQYMNNGYALAEAIGLAHEQARMEGFTDDDDEPTDPTKPTKPSGEAPGEMADAAKDPSGTPLSTENHPEIIQHLVGGAVVKPPKTDCDCEEGDENCDCKKDDAKAPTLAQFIAENIAKLNPGETVDAKLIEDLTKIYQETYAQGEKTLVENKEVQTEVAASTSDSANNSAQGKNEQVPVTQKEVYASGHTKAQIVEHWKSFMAATDPMIEKRHAEVKRFFSSMKRVMMNRYGGNLKAFGAFKARNSDDADEITKLDAYDKVLKEFVDNIDGALSEAYKFGFGDTLANFKFGDPNAKALEYLKKYAAKEVTQITETTMDQMHRVLTDAFEEGVDVGEVGRRIQDTFADISEGRAKTIARTETLSAVSAGREEKRWQWQEEFPDKVLRKMWVSAQDEKVRDSHQEVDGEVVDSTDQFSNGLSYPREDGGPAEEVINCRCTDITFPADDEQKVRDTLPSDEEPTDEEATHEEVKPEDDNNDDKDEKSALGESLPNKGGPGSGGARAGAGRKPGSGKPKPSESEAAHEERHISNRERSTATDRGFVAETSAQFNEIKKDNPKLEKALKDWTNFGYKEIRQVQQGKTTYRDGAEISRSFLNTAKKNLAEMEASFKELPVYDGPILRGLKTALPVKPGDTFTTEAFSSFTAKMKDEVGFASFPTVLRVHQNNSGRAIWGLSTHDTELEVLVPKGVQYKVTNVSTEPFYSSKRTVIDLKEVKSKSADLNDLFNAIFDEPLFDRDDGQKGGPGSGGAREGAGRKPGMHHEVTSTRDRQEYQRPPLKRLAPERISAANRTNRFQDNIISKYTDSKTFLDKKGKDVSPIDTSVFQRYATQELGNNFVPQLEKATNEMSSEGINIVSVEARAKEFGSLQDKMNGKWADKTLDQVTDGIGGRIVVQNMHDLDSVVAKMPRLGGMEILEHQDFTRDPQSNGYRAVHLLVRTPGGMIAELQVKTENEQIWSKWSHRNIYKNADHPELKVDKEVSDYTKAVADRLYQIDLGQKPTGSLPEAPKALKDLGVSFPWHEVDKKPLN